MSKPFFVISCPVDTYSGYGARSRDLVKAIHQTGKYNLRILPQRWGETPWNFIEDHPEWHFVKELMLMHGQLPKQPDIWMQVTVPNEFTPVGKYNIGVTAGIETTVCIPQWIEGCNRMNLILASSEHSAEVFRNSKFQQADERTKQVQRTIELTTPVKVLFEGVNLDIYKTLESSVQSVKTFEELQYVKEDFAYLFVGHWMQGDLGEDRKNVGLMIKAFYETFKNKAKKPALILKASGGAASYLDKENILTKIRKIRETVASNNLPNIYLLHGEFSDQEMNLLYNHPKVKAMVSFTKGEGFGRPLLEFTLAKKPIIASGWSGQMDFLDPDLTCLIRGELKPVHASAVNDFLIADSQWFAPSHAEIGFYLRDVFEHYKKYTVNAKRQAHASKTKFSFEKMVELVDEILTANVPEFPKEVQLQLPKLKKIELPKLKKLEDA